MKASSQNTCSNILFHSLKRMVRTLFNPLIPGASLKKSVTSVLSIAITLAGCATSSKDIASTYASPLQYQAYDCSQLAAETSRVQARVVETGGRLDQAASNDKAIMGVGMILFWPALFALGGTKQQEAEFGRLKGEYEAIQKTAIDKKCPNIVPATPVTPVAATPATGG